VQPPQPNEARFAHYEILRELAQGTYTAVYEARHTHPRLRDRPVTLKILRRSRDARRFLHAARLNAGLNHPRIPALHDVGVVAGRPYTARQFIDGDDLENGIGAGRDVAEVTRIVADIAGVLDYAHGRGVVHGYVHPRHILLGRDGSAWLIGFGEHPPADVMFQGNPLHLAPEQFVAGRTTPATDVFALSETAVWLLCGRHPFERVQAAELLETKRAAALWPGIPAAVARVLVRGLAPDAADRYARAGEFAAALASAGRTG
jgi:serine/threonine protein kinase